MTEARPPVPETPLDRWLRTYFAVGKPEVDPESPPIRDLLAIVRTARSEAAERGFREGFAKGVAAIIGAKEIRDRHIRFTHPDFVKDTSKAWAASALHAELEEPT